MRFWQPNGVACPRIGQVALLLPCVGRCERCGAYKAAADVALNYNSPKSRVSAPGKTLANWAGLKPNWPASKPPRRLRYSLRTG